MAPMLKLNLRQRSGVPLEVEGITPDTIRDKSLAEIEKLPMYQGNCQLPLAEFFAIAGEPADEAAPAAHDEPFAKLGYAAVQRSGAIGIVRGVTIVAPSKVAPNVAREPPSPGGGVQS